MPKINGKTWAAFRSVAILCVVIVSGWFIAERTIGRWGRDTALLAAVQSGDVSRAEALLDQGANIETRSAEGQDNHGRPYADLTPLALAARKGNGDMVKMLVRRGANVKAKSLADSDRFPARDLILTEAASTCDADVIALLLAKGAVVDARSSMEVTPLMMAARDNRLETAKLLLRQGADVNARDDRGFTPLDFATGKRRDDHSQMIRLLKERNAHQ